MVFVPGGAALDPTSVILQNIFRLKYSSPDVVADDDSYSPQIERILQRYRSAIPVPPEDDDTNITWGAPQDFEELGRPAFSIGWNVDYGDDENEDEDEDTPGTRTYREVGKDTEDVRVENPEDADQYVIVQRRKTSVFEGPDDILVTFHWDNTNLGGTVV